MKETLTVEGLERVDERLREARGEGRYLWAASRAQAELWRRLFPDVTIFLGGKTFYQPATDTKK